MDGFIVIETGYEIEAKPVRWVATVADAKKYMVEAETREANKGQYRKVFGWKIAPVVNGVIGKAE